MLQVSIGIIVIVRSLCIRGSDGLRDRRSEGDMFRCRLHVAYFITIERKPFENFAHEPSGPHTERAGDIRSMSDGAVSSISEDEYLELYRAAREGAGVKLPVYAEDGSTVIGEFIVDVL